MQFIYSNRRLTEFWYSSIHTWALSHMYGLPPRPGGVLTPGEWKTYVISHKAILDAHYPADSAREEFILGEMIRTIRKRGGRVFLMEFPHPAGDDSDAAWRHDYLERIKRLSAKWGVSYWDLNERLNLKKDLFIDPMHVNQEGQDIWTRSFIDWFEGIHSYD